jgi:hypothetical protein
MCSLHLFNLYATSLGIRLFLSAIVRSLRFEVILYSFQTQSNPMQLRQRPLYPLASRFLKFRLFYVRLYPNFCYLRLHFHSSRGQKSVFTLAQREINKIMRLDALGKENKPN